MELTKKEKAKMLVDVPVDYFKARKKYKRTVHKLNPKYQKSYTLYFFSIVKDLLVNGEADINKYSAEELSDETLKKFKARREERREERKQGEK